MAEDYRPKQDYRFLNWHYSPNRRALSGLDGEVRIKPLLDRLLLRFLEEPGSTLTREQLIAEVWSRREVNDEVLSRAVAELRSLLGDDARNPSFIETLPKGGYRWIAPLLEHPGIAEPVSAGDGTRPASVSRSRPRWLLWTLASLLAIAVLSGIFWLTRADKDNTRARLAVELLQARPLASDSRLEFDARFDDTGRVIYIRMDPTNDISELVILEPSSQAERVLWENRGALRHPAPAPDGSEIALLQLGEHSCEIWSVSVVDARRSRLGDCSAAAVGSLEWTDGGNSLLYTGNATDEVHASGLMLLDRRRNESRRLTTPTVQEGAHVNPRLSADGKTLVYASMRGTERQLWRSDWPGMQQTGALLKRPEPVYGHAFEPRSDTLWIAGDLTLYRALHRLRRGGEPELIGGRGALSIDLAASGAAVWSEANYDADIQVQQSVGAGWTTVARSNRYESHPEFSPDGKMLALASNRNGAESVFVVNLTDGSTRPLALHPGYRWVRPTWSTRGKALIITAYEEQQTRLYRYLLDGDILSALPDVEAGAYLGVELDERLLYLNGHGTDQSTLMQMQDGRSKAENLGLGPVATFRASSDWLVWRKPGSNTLHLAPMPGLQPVREVHRGDAAIDEAFALAGSTLYYLDKEGLWSMQLPDGQAKRVATENLPNGSGPSLAVSSEGAIAVVRLSSLSIDLMFAEAPDPSR